MSRTKKKKRVKPRNLVAPAARIRGSAGPMRDKRRGKRAEQRAKKREEGED